MSLVNKCLIFIAVVGMAGLFVIKKPDGGLWLEVSDFIPSASSIKAWLRNAVPEQVVGGSDVVAVYRWQDAEGNWRYSDKPLAEGAEQVMVSTDLNKDLVPIRPEPAAPSSEPKKGKALLIKDSRISSNTVSSGKIPELIDEAKSIQQLMDARTGVLEDVLDASE